MIMFFCWTIFQQIERYSKPEQIIEGIEDHFGVSHRVGLRLPDEEAVKP